MKCCTVKWWRYIRYCHFKIVRYHSDFITPIHHFTLKLMVVLYRYKWYWFALVAVGFTRGLYEVDSHRLFLHGRVTCANTIFSAEVILHFKFIYSSMHSIMETTKSQQFLFQWVLRTKVLGGHPELGVVGMKQCNFLFLVYTSYTSIIIAGNMFPFDDAIM